MCDFSQEACTGYNNTKVSHNFLCFQKLRSRTADVAEWVINLLLLIYFFGYRGCHIWNLKQNLTAPWKKNEKKSVPFHSHVEPRSF